MPLTPLRVCVYVGNERVCVVWLRTPLCVCVCVCICVRARDLPRSLCNAASFTRVTRAPFDCIGEKINVRHAYDCVRACVCVRCAVSEHPVYCHFSSGVSPDTPRCLTTFCDFNGRNVSPRVSLFATRSHAVYIHRSKHQIAL